MAKLSSATRRALEELAQGNPPPEDADVFGAMVPYQEAGLVLLPVHWEATTSYGQGTVDGPEAIVRASHQLDLVDRELGPTFMAGIATLPADPRFRKWDEEAKPRAKKIIADLTAQKAPSGDDLQAVNRLSAEVNKAVYEASRRALDDGKAVAVLGGDHSSPLGLMQALGERYREGYGVLHIDAHHDLRAAYEGFKYSHASIMYNMLEEIPAVAKLVTIGIRDFSQFEADYAERSPRVVTYYDQDIFARKARGESFHAVASAMVNELPENVYISFDIDGLSPAFCPHTGTPVPGGLDYQEAMYLMNLVAKSGRKVIGFDLCEVAPGPDGSEWDANVGARVLYKLCGTVTHSLKLYT